MIRKQISVEIIKRILSKYHKQDIMVGDHCYEQIKPDKRDISEDLIKNYLIKKDLYFAEEQIKNNEIRYKIVFRLSNKYDLILVITEKKPKVLKVITAIKTSKKIKKEWQKKSKLAMMR